MQLVGPPEQEWIQTIESRGVKVVEPLSSYGLFVYGIKEDIDALNQLDFVKWTGPFKPAYRIDDELKDMRGKIRYVNVGIYPASSVDGVRQELKEIGAEIVDEWDQSGRHRESYRVLIIEVWRRRLRKNRASARRSLVGISRQRT